MKAYFLREKNKLNSKFLFEVRGTRDDIKLCRHAFCPRLTHDTVDM